MSDKTSNTSSSWISRPVFISSTFKDMQAERDHLNKVVFPELAERLRERKVLLEPIDLRQGVEVKEEKDVIARELLTLKVCLQEIDNSRPMLIVLLGDRYGWTPDKERLEAAAHEKGFDFDVKGKSVTALEIEYGLLKRDRWLRTNSLFLFREPLPYDKMPQDKKEEFSEKYSNEPNAADNAKNLEALKQKIKVDPELRKRIRPYSLGWDAEKNEITGLEAWGNQVKEEIWQILYAETKDIEQSLPKTWEEEENHAIEELVEDRSRNFVGREDIISKLLAFAHSEAKEGADWGACVTAGPGTGKSALFAKLNRELEHDESVLLLSHAAGITPKSGDVDSMLLRWITELSAFLNMTNPLPEKYSLDDLDNTFALMLSRSSVKKRVVVLIDALNQFNPNTRSLHMTWLKRPWPSNARIIATAIEGEASEGLAQWVGVQEYELGGLSPKNAEDIITAIYKKYHRQVNLKVKDILLNKPGLDGEKAYTNPLWLNLALEQLNLLDEDDFARALASKEDPAELIANDVPGDISGLYEWILKRLEKTYGTAWVVSIIALVALSRQGWREMDFEAMLTGVADLLFPNQKTIKWDPLKFAVIRRGLRGQLIQSGSYGRWRFMHQQMQKAVLAHKTNGMETSLSDTTIQQLMHTDVCDYLLKKKEGDPIRTDETMWHLIEADDKKRAAKYYGSNLSEEESYKATRAIALFIENQPQELQEEAIIWVCSLLRQDIINFRLNYELVNHFMGDLNDSLLWTINLAHRAIVLETAKETILKALESNPNDTILLRYLNISYGKIGDLYWAQGNLPATLSAYQTFMRINEKLKGSGFDNYETLQNLSVCYNRIGGIYKSQGNLTAALAAYQSNLEISESLCHLFQGHPKKKWELSIVYDNIRTVYFLQGNLSDALKSYQTSIDLSKELSITDTNSAVLLREMSGKCNRIGRIYVAQGNINKSLESFQVGMEIAEKLSASDPDNKLWRWDLAVIYDSIGTTYQAIDDLSAALKSFQACLVIGEELSAIDDNALWQRDFAVIYDHIGFIYETQGNLSAAHTMYLKSIKIKEKLVSIDPRNTDWQRDLSCGYLNIVGIHKAQNNLSDALSLVQKTLDISVVLANRDPKNTEWQRDLSICYENLGNIYQLSGNIPSSIIAYNECIKIRGDLIDLDTNNAEWLHDLWGVCCTMASLYFDQKSIDCVIWYQRVVNILDHMISQGMYVSQHDIERGQSVREFLNQVIKH